PRDEETLSHARPPRRAVGPLPFTPCWTRRCVMLSLLTGYLVVVGGATAGVQAARGVVRGVGRLAQGEPRAALAQVAGGLVAPVLSLVHQAAQLGGEVCLVAASLGDEGRQTDVRQGRAA